MRDYTEKIETLKKQQEQAKELFVKLQGAIEVLTSMQEEEPEKTEKKKEFFEIIRGMYGEQKQYDC